MARVVEWQLLIMRFVLAESGCRGGGGRHTDQAHSPSFRDGNIIVSFMISVLMMSVIDQRWVKLILFFAILPLKCFIIRSNFIYLILFNLLQYLSSVQRVWKIDTRVLRRNCLNFSVIRGLKYRFLRVHINDAFLKMSPLLHIRRPIVDALYRLHWWRVLNIII